MYDHELLTYMYLVKVATNGKGNCTWRRELAGRDRRAWRRGDEWVRRRAPQRMHLIDDDDDVVDDTPSSLRAALPVAQGICRLPQCVWL